MTDRREFLKSVSRGIILSALVGMSGMLILRRTSDGEECDFEFICKNCKNLTSCKLPEADNYKEKDKNKK